MLRYPKTAILYEVQHGITHKSPNCGTHWCLAWLPYPKVVFEHGIPPIALKVSNLQIPAAVYLHDSQTYPDPQRLLSNFVSGDETTTDAL